MIEEMLKHNREFVANGGYRKFETSKYPDKKLAIVTCMDTRLGTLLPAALGIDNGDVKMIKNAGGTITNPFDSTMRSLLIAVYELGVQEIMVIGHTGCGVQGMNAQEMVELMLKRGGPGDLQLASWIRGHRGGSTRDCRPGAQSSAHASGCGGARIYHRLADRRTQSSVSEPINRKTEKIRPSWHRSRQRLPRASRLAGHVRLLL